MNEVIEYKIGEEYSILDDQSKDTWRGPQKYIYEGTKMMDGYLLHCFKEIENPKNYMLFRVGSEL